MSKFQVPTKTPAYVMLSSDYSAQEPRILAFISSDPKLCDAFTHNRDPYGTVASVAFNVPYEECLEFHPETGEYQPEGKRRRSEAKTVLLGVMYGRAIPSIADQLYGKRKDMSRDEKIKSAQHVYDSIMAAFPNIRQAMLDAQAQARSRGYTETILGRRRHIPNMQLPLFEFVPTAGYVNPDIDPLDPDTLDQTDKIPKRVVAGLEKEFAGYKYFGQKVKRIKQLAEEHIKVINNEAKIGDGSRQCLNCVDTETEIFTIDGWKKYDEISTDSSVLQVDPHSGRYEYGLVSAVHYYPNEHQPLVHLIGDGLDSICTLNHRWPLMDQDDQIHLVETKDILGDMYLDGYSFLVDAIVHPKSVPVREVYHYEVPPRPVWCVTTHTHTWVARRNGKVFLTGNSIIQGSAADQTKMAILLLENNEEWHKLGGRLLTPVHDELICEIPIENYERGGELLSSLMVQAADFLPFTSKCDVTTSYRWYGLEYPCQHKKPQAFNSLEDICHLDEDETCWLQYMLYEMEYPLPTHKEILGEEFRGDRALGIDGIYSDELVEFVKDYMDRYRVSINDFVDAIWLQVDQGTIPNTY